MIKCFQSPTQIPKIEISCSISCILLIDIWNTNIVCVTAIVLSMGTQFVNKEEIVSGTHNADSVTLCLSSLRVLTEMYIFIFLLSCFI